MCLQGTVYNERAVAIVILFPKTVNDAWVVKFDFILSNIASVPSYTIDVGTSENIN